MISTRDIEKKLQASLSKARFEHSLNVATLAAHLAQLHDWDSNLAYRAGLCHDSAKEWTPAKLARYCRMHRLPVPNFKFIVDNSPNLLHAYAAAYFVKVQKWITDRASIKAIESHTLGALKMSVPEKIVFVADFASKDREYDAALKVRELADTNLDQAFRLALRKKIKWSLKLQKPIHPFAVLVWNTHVSK